MSATVPAAPFVRAIRLGEGGDDYSGDLPALRGLERLELDPRVTFLVGENGSGKSTLLEATAVAAKLNVEGGGKLLKFSTRSTHSQLHRRLTLERSELPPLNAFFLRAESVFNLATAIDPSCSATPRRRSSSWARTESGESPTTRRSRSSSLDRSSRIPAASYGICWQTTERPVRT